ncbi:histidine phosphatase family protein [Gloeocapsopsis crepidinum LEGE 06123]|uniref:Histidine phosphatase family protein n=1 Tax=Gloeocapsopsis crepidinum LEGE 06123 TaxID=588587 RepID=A0ABR9UR59_9CHRO|nr:histidine phosphatase family protein [Gloeocapsopsis crepidinum]MBE9190774.1 histidine phosphatase family protein [Gloeocapsopsis crepidinum LEGE 06123]
MDSQSSAELGSTRVILVRHGQSTFNAEGRYQGRSNESVLTAKGYQSAYQTGVALQRIPIDAIYTSPLQRALETTQEIIKGINPQNKSLLEFNINSNLTEIDLPAWQGKTFEYVRNSFAAEYKCWQQRPHEFQINSPNENSGYHHVATALKQCFPVLNLYEQAQQFWQILPHHLGKTILVVSHGGTNHALIGSALNLSPAQYHTIQQSNCGISILNFPANSQSAQLRGLNLTSHLGEVLPKLKAGKQGLRLLLLPVDAIASNQVQHLAEFLKPVSIDFSLTSELCISQEITTHLLQNHPTTVQLQVSRHNFPVVWQQTIDSRRSSILTNTLVTGLVVASSAIIKCILGQILGLSTHNFWRLQLNSGDLSVVHYPLGNNLPVSQAINLSDNQIKL